MATLLLSAAGAAIGANFGGAVLGLSGMVIGRAVGAGVGRAIDQRLLGGGSGAVPGGSIQRIRVTGAGEGAAVSRVWGRVRLAGQIIWASPFEEIPGQTRSGKGGFGSGVTDASRYVISLAVALCEGQIGGITRLWANGDEVALSTLNLRVYPGDGVQMPDPKIAAIEGTEATPAYRGTAYVVIEDLDLAPFGNRVPSLSFEVVRAAQAEGVTTLQDAVAGVAWLPGSGEYALATDPVEVMPEGTGLSALMGRRVVNRNSPSGESDFRTALDRLGIELPKAKSSLLIATWFGNDLRCSRCAIRPMIEARDHESPTMPWTVAGLNRQTAEALPRVDGRSVYGGTPTDQTVIEAIAALKEAGQAVVFYPFVMMDILNDNGLSDPWSGAPDQPALPWRGRITLDVAPGRDGTADRSALAAQEVDAFFGTASAADFTVGSGSVQYSGPDEWRYRRFVLHYAALCAAAGGVDAFCIGSELRGLTSIRGQNDSFPAVVALRALAAEVRTLLGPQTRLTYAADWSEYAGHDAGNGTRYFHLDALWADANIDAIGIDNYMPLADWRDGRDHADRAAGWSSTYDLDYLKSNIAGGEGFDWYYPDDQARAVQRRVPITDGLGAPWVWRVKDLRRWWETAHSDRFEGGESLETTDWIPRSKPVWFVEYGCAAIDKGANQPNVFFDPKSSESALPWFSDGQRDDTMQMQYIRAMAEFWADPENNPISDIYGGPMLEWSRSHAWAWDARPWPWFPALGGTWGDGDNWTTGHWLTGRSSAQPLAAVVAEICQTAGVTCFDVSSLHGVVRGYTVDSTATGRAALQPLMLVHGFEAIERNGCLTFVMRGAGDALPVDQATLVAQPGGDLQAVRAPAGEEPGAVRLTYLEAEGTHGVRSVEAVMPDTAAAETIDTELPLSLTAAEARGAVKRWLAEARIGRDTVRFAVSPNSALGVGDVVRFLQDPQAQTFRLDRAELVGPLIFEATRIELPLYAQRERDTDRPDAGTTRTEGAVVPVLLDLPMVSLDSAPHVLRVAATAAPWVGPAAVYDAPEDGTFALRGRIERRATIGQLVAPLSAARPGLIQRAGVDIAFGGTAALGTIDFRRVLDGGNRLALGDGTTWEIVQFTTAELVGPNLWRLGGLLRGQFGTAPLIPPTWGLGTWAVLLDASITRLDMTPGDRGQTRRWRIGPASRPFDDPTYTEISAAPRFTGLRPYAPVHLRQRDAGGAHHLSWVRQTRLGGDAWDVVDVPLAEDVERYRVTIDAEGAVRREMVVDAPAFTYSAAMRASDGVAGSYRVRVAQLSSAYGVGLAAELLVG
ncbi:MAG: glycoside hydrolase/phage tail family protein [Paracoccaceae bacterium]